MADINVSMGVDNTGALKSLKQVETGINNLVNKFGKLKSVAVSIKLNTGNAAKEIADIQAKLNGMNASVTGSIKLDNTAAIAAINEVRSKLASLNLTTSSNILIDNSAAVGNINELLSRLSILNGQIDDTRTIRVNTDNADRSIRNLGNGAKSAGAGFSILTTAIASLGLSQLIINATTMATTISNLSRSTDIGITSIKNYADAISAAGGDARGAVEDLTDLTKSIDEARNGNSDAQIGFSKLGITLSDLSKLSEEDIFKRTVQGLAKIDDASKRTTMSMSLLGGEFKKVDVRAVAERMSAPTIGEGADVGAIKAAAEAQKAMAQNMSKLGDALLKALKPLNEFVATVDISVKAFDRFIKITAALVATIASFWIFNKFYSAIMAIGQGMSSTGAVVSVFGAALSKLKGLFLSVGAGFQVIAEAFATGATVGTRILAVFAGIGIVVLRLANIVGIIYTVTQALDWLLDTLFGFSIIDDSIKYLSKMFSGINSIGDAVKAMAGIFLLGINSIDYFIQKITGFSVIDWVDEKIGGITNAIKTFAKFLFIVPTAIDFLLEKMSGFSIFDWAIDKLDKMVVGLTKVLSLQAKVGTQADVRRVDNKIAEDNPEIFKMAKKEDDKGKTVIDAQRGIRIELQKTLAAYQDQNAELTRTMAFSNQMIGLDDESINRKQKLFDLESNYLGQIKALRDQYVAMRDAAASGTDEEKKAFSAFASQYASFAGKITAEYERQKVQVNDLISGEERLKGIEQARLDIINQMVDAENRRNSLASATNSAFGDLFAKISDSKAEMELALLSPLERQREEIRKNATLIENEMVKKLTEAFTNEEGDIIDPERLGKQIAKARAMIEELKNTQMGTLETSQTWASGWDQAFKEYADSATTAAEHAKSVFQTVTSAMEDMLKNFVQTGKLDFKSLAASIITTLTSKALTDSFKNLMVTGNSQFGGAGGLLGSLFGMGNGGTNLSQAAYAGISGFADGGSPPVGKISMVGERGPELFMPKSAGTIIPNHMLGVSQPQPQPIVNNYYNSVTVSAVDSVDASRFIMANKSMIFAANETARRSIPGNQVRK
jgi:lambda family phage tail tape measure protein